MIPYIHSGLFLTSCPSYVLVEYRSTYQKNLLYFKTVARLLFNLSREEGLLLCDNNIVCCPIVFNTHLSNKNIVLDIQIV